VPLHLSNILVYKPVKLHPDVILPIRTYSKSMLNLQCALMRSRTRTSPWAQQRSSCSSRGRGALSPVLHPAAHQLMRDHPVEQEDEHRGVHSDEIPGRLQKKQPKRCNFSHSSRFLLLLLRWARALHYAITSKPLVSRPESRWQQPLWGPRRMLP